MKTIVDTNDVNSVNRYLKLFEMANDVFQKYPDKAPKDPLTNEILTISSLEQYFTCIGTLKEIDPKFGYLLPLDERFFEIDADTREIIVPKDYSKGVGVQSDVIAETLLFKINRFVDAKDLNDVPQIYIQWQFELQNNIIDEGYSRVPFRYIDYDPNYLIFAWPLSGRVTKNAGTLKFSVRFEVKGGEGIVYSFNTKPATVIINPALKTDLNYDEEVDDASELFRQAIQDSQQTSTPDKDGPVRPDFTLDGGQAWPTKAYLKNDQLDLTAQAIVTDTGDLSYIMYLSSQAIESKGAEKDENYYKPSTDSTRKNSKRYYVKVDENRYSLYTKNVTNGKGENNEILYEKTARLKIPATISGATPAQITGEYALDAVNRLGWGANSTVGDAEKRQIMKIPGPEVIEFVSNKDLPERNVFTIIDKDYGENYYFCTDADLVSTKTYYIKDADDIFIEYVPEKIIDGKTEDGTQLYEKDSEFVDLNIEVNVDADVPLDADQPQVSYVWEKTIDGTLQYTNDGKIEVIPNSAKWYPVPEKTRTADMDATESSIKVNKTMLAQKNPDANSEIINLPGWYRVTVTSTLNRESKSEYSTICKVTQNPMAPGLDHPEDAQKIVDKAVGDIAQFELKIVDIDKYKNLLYSESLTYQWFDNEVPVEGKSGNVNLDTGIIPLEFSVSAIPNVYTCQVTNTLNGKTAVATSGTFIAY